MTVDNRLPSPFGTLIDRSQTVEFSFEKKTISGYAGDTVASALAANNQWLLSRSFKYHRPRGVLTMARPRRQQHGSVALGPQRTGGSHRYKPRTQGHGSELQRQPDPR